MLKTEGKVWCCLYLYVQHLVAPPAVQVCQCSIVFKGCIVSPRFIYLECWQLTTMSCWFFLQIFWNSQIVQSLTCCPQLLKQLSRHYVLLWDERSWHASLRSVNWGHGSILLAKQIPQIIHFCHVCSVQACFISAGLTIMSHWNMSDVQWIEDGRMLWRMVILI